MKTWSQFYPFVEVEVMNCPRPVIDHHLRQAARDFCERSKAWREWVDAVTADGSTNLFDYDLSAGQELVKITRAVLNDHDIAVTAGSGLPQDWQTGTSSEFCGLVHFDEQQYMVFPVPDAGDVIRIEMAFMPSNTAVGVGDIVFDNFADDVAAGAKARLLALPNAPWASPAAVGYRTQYEAAVHRAANQDFARRVGTQRGTKPVQSGWRRWQ